MKSPSTYPLATLSLTLLIAACDGSSGGTTNAAFADPVALADPVTDPSAELGGGAGDGVVAPEVLVDGGSGGRGAGSVTSSDAGGGADPRADSDRDGMSDFAEVVCGSNPVDGASVAADADADGRPDCLGGYPTLPVTGAPGDTVDCGATLPCTWTSPDAALTLRLTSAGFVDPARVSRIGPALGVRFEILSSRDAELAFLEGSEALDRDGEPYADTYRTLGETAGDGTIESPVEGGTPLVGVQVFDRGTGALATLLTDLAMTFAEAGVTLAPHFLNVPAGYAPSVDARCDDALPCIWTSADGTSRLALESLAANGDGTLRAGFAFRTDREDGLAIELTPYSGARSADGDAFGLASQRLGEADPGAARIERDAGAGERIVGELVLEPAEGNTGSEVEALERAVVTLYPAGGAVPRFLPVFRDLPVAR